VSLVQGPSRATAAPPARSSDDQRTRTTVVPARVMRSVIWAGVVPVTLAGGPASGLVPVTW
jgi:hypothetical protein